MIRIFAAIISLIVMLTSVGFGYLLPVKSLYYGVLIAASFVIMFSHIWDVRKFDWRCVVFLAVAALSIIFNNVSLVFRPWQRFGGFAMLMIVFSPMCRNAFAVKLRYYVMKYMKLLIVVFVLISFALYFMPVPFIFGRGGFHGIFNHSMMLGPMAGVAAIICLDLAFRGVGIKRLVWWVCVVLCVITAVLSASRGAVGALLGAVTIYLMFHYRSQMGRFVVSFAVGASLIMAFIAINPYNFMDNLTDKMEARRDLDDELNRLDTWEERIADFNSSPVYGIGFASVQTMDNTSVSSDGKVESGSGWLMILGSMGLLGLITFVLILLRPVVFVWQRRLDVPVLVSMVCFYAIHSFAEGYVIAFGSVLACMFWLSLGLLNDVYYEVNRG